MKTKSSIRKPTGAFRMIRKSLPTTTDDHGEKFIVRVNGKLFFTKLSMVVIMLGLIDIVFAVDSIPAVFPSFRIRNDKLLIYSSNIFAVLGLSQPFLPAARCGRPFSVSATWHCGHPPVHRWKNACGQMDPYPRLGIPHGDPGLYHRSMMYWFSLQMTAKPEDENQQENS